MKTEIIIIALIGITYSLTLQEIPNKKINETTNNELVQIQGIIKQCINTEHLTIINLTDETGSIKTIFFENTECVKNALIEIKGRTDYYNKEKELKGVKIKYLNYSLQ